MVMRSGSGRTRSTTSPPGISGRMCLVTLGSELLACSPHVPIGPPLAYRHHAIRGRTNFFDLNLIQVPPGSELCVPCGRLAGTRVDLAEVGWRTIARPDLSVARGRG